MKKKMNIMTSCDDGIAQYILPQLVSINKQLGAYDVDFFLMHSRISDEKLQLIRDFCDSLDNIELHEIRLKDNKQFDTIVKYGDARNKPGGKLWPAETYYWYYAHFFLPKELERIMYIDAGDVIMTGDIGEYYYKDFSDKLFVATARLLITREGKTEAFKKSDMENDKILGTILGAGTFCAGTIVINLPEFRKTVIKGYVEKYIETLKLRFPGEKCLYMGDQGLASGVFAGDIEYFSRNGTMDVWYKPYNFPVGNFYEREREDFDYSINVVHFNQGKTYKPWVARFDVDEVSKYDFRVDGAAGPAPFIVTKLMLEFYEIWWDYCKETPIYEEVNERASIAAKALQMDFLPLNEDFNKLFVKNKSIEQKYNKLNESFSSILAAYPLLTGVSTDSVPFLKTVIIAVLREDMQSALDEVLRMSDEEIPDEHAECYLNLAQLICAATEYAEGWVFFKKELVNFLINNGSREKAQQQLTELDELLPDDDEIKALRSRL